MVIIVDDSDNSLQCACDDGDSNPDISLVHQDSKWFYYMRDIVNPTIDQQLVRLQVLVSFCNSNLAYLYQPLPYLRFRKGPKVIDAINYTHTMPNIVVQSIISTV
jgi:hypothetical protein